MGYSKRCCPIAQTNQKLSAEMTLLTAQIYSPRWGHKDKYDIDLTQDTMTISVLNRTARCEWRENRDPVW
jgi:hypothetical protein